MSLLAHVCCAVNGTRATADRANLDRRIRFETQEARRIQAEIGCSWAEALRLAAGGPR